jgi:hypothetical protein
MKTSSAKKRIYLQFERPEDLELYDRLAKDAVEKRYDLPVYTLLVLLAAYPKTLSGTGEEVDRVSPE